MKILFALILGITTYVSGYLFVNQSEEAVVGANPWNLQSIQLAPSPQNGYVLSTDGTDNSWIVNVGGSGGGLFTYDSGTDTISPLVASTSNSAFLKISGITGTSTTATSTLPLLSTNMLIFATTSALTPTLGQLTWDADEGTLSLGLNGGLVANQIGQETVAYVKADESISNGDVVYASSAVGASSKIGVSKYIANNTIAPKYILGIATEDIALGEFGYVTTFGKVRGISTDGSTVGESWSDGTLLFASAATSGALTNVEPTAPNEKVPIAFVIASHASNGTIMVRYPDTYDIHEINDVLVTSIADKHALMWDNADSRWENRLLVEADISDLGTYLTSVGPTNMNATDFGDWTCNGTICTLDANTVGDSEIDYTAVTLADFTNDAGFLTGNDTITLSGDVTGTGTSSITTAIASGVIIEPDLDVDDTPSDGDILTYDTTGTNFVWETILDLVNTITGAVNWGGITSFEIPNGTNPTTDAAGEIALDTTDNQLIVDDGTNDMVFRGETVIRSFALASTTIAASGFASGQVFELTSEKDGFEITQFRCHVVGGTSIVANISDGTSDTETITCGTTVTSDTDVATNDTFTADEIPEIQLGTVTGTPNWLYFTIYGRFTRE